MGLTWSRQNEHRSKPASEKQAGLNCLPLYINLSNKIPQEDCLWSGLEDSQAVPGGTPRAGGQEHLLPLHPGRHSHLQGATSYHCPSSD